MKSITQVIQNLLKPYIDNKDKAIYEVMGQNGAKNYLEITERFVKNPPASTFRVKSYSENGIVIDGTVSTAQNMRISPADDDTSFVLPAGDYVLSNDGGALPTGLTITVRKNGVALVSENSLATPYEFSANGTDYFVVLIHENAATYTDAIVSPMIRLASDTDNTFRPYSKRNSELTKASSQNASDISGLNTSLANEVITRAKLGGHNLLPFDLNVIKTGNTSGTWSGNTYTDSGISFTFNDNGTITVSGVATARVGCRCYIGDMSQFSGMTLSGCPEGGGMWSTYAIYGYGNSSQGVLGVDEGNGATIPTNTENGTINCVVENGTDLTTPKTFKPMIRLATDADTTYAPYSMTNQQITPYAQTQSNRNLLDNPWFTVNQRGKTTFDGGGNDYFVDRWKIVDGNDSSISISATNEGLVYAATGTPTLDTYIRQNIESSRLVKNATYTASVLLEATKSVTTYIQFRTSDNSNLLSKSFTVPANKLTLITLTGYIGDISTDIVYFRTFLNYNRAQNDVTVKVHAAKFELGSVSTLDRDTAPNYAEELLKCQRYFQRVEGISSTFLVNRAFSTNDVRISMPITPMRSDTPTVTTNADKLNTDGTGATVNITGTCTSVRARGNLLSFVVHSDDTTPFTVGGILGAITISSGTLYVEISADL